MAALLFAAAILAPFSTPHKNDILAIVVGASFASGLNVYASLQPWACFAPERFFSFLRRCTSSSHGLSSESLALFLLELFADKIPVFDLLWNALHTFIRVPIAALLSYGATQHMSPGTQLPRRCWWNHCFGVAWGQNGS